MYRLQTALAALLISYSAGVTAHETGSKIERGEYLTTILSCGGCHTEGALLGEQTGAWLAGSKIGIAFDEDPDTGLASAVVFPANLTGDKPTGLGAWSKRDIINLLTSGKKHSGKLANMVMPWANYRLLNQQDIEAIATYLKSLPPVKNDIPAQIYPGETIDQRYVRFGVYLFLPDASATGAGD